MIRQPSVDALGILTEADYQFMVGLTNTLPNPPNYPSAIAMSSLLRHDVVMFDDEAGAFLSNHRNDGRNAIVSRYLLPIDIRQKVAWALAKESFEEVASRWPDTLDWPVIAPFRGNPDPKRVSETWELFFKRWSIVGERPKAINDDDVGWSIYWPKLRYLLSQVRSQVFDVA